MRAFFDSNVIIYALSDDGTGRHGMAQELVARHAKDRTLVLSTQVLLETYNVLTRKQHVAAADLLAALQLLARNDVVAPTPHATLQALQLAGGHQLPTFDALIVQAALQGGCGTLFSEDFQNGRRFGPVEVVNPFKLQVDEPAAAYAVASAPRSARKAAPKKR